MATAATTQGSTAIRPFRVSFPDEALLDLRRRIQATRWPDGELVADGSQGVKLEPLRALARYWATDYDWRKCEARLNALPMFVTHIDGLDIQVIHVRSKHDDAMPLIITHGWPGSIIERALSRAAELGREGLSQAHLLQPRRGRRSLRSMGAAGAVHLGDARGVQVAPRNWPRRLSESTVQRPLRHRMAVPER